MTTQDKHVLCAVVSFSNCVYPPGCDEKRGGRGEEGAMSKPPLDLDQNRRRMMRRRWQRDEGGRAQNYETGSVAMVCFSHVPQVELPMGKTKASTMRGAGDSERTRS